VPNSNGKKGPDGRICYGGVTLDAAGNLYGTAYYGGAYAETNLNAGGMVWEITASGAYADLHDFGGTVTNANGSTGPDGANPYTGVTIDSAGNLLGTANKGGPYGSTSGQPGAGMVWEIGVSGIYRDLHDFGGTVMNANGKTSPDGSNPVGLAIDRVGNLFGATAAGGPINTANGGDGIIWKITTSGTYIDLHDFGRTMVNADGTQGLDGSSPNGVSLDDAGNLYGTTSSGGPFISHNSYGGMLWEIPVEGSYADLHDFGGTDTNADGTTGPDGIVPMGAVTFDSAGKLVGTTRSGGPNGMGAKAGLVWSFAMKPKGTVLVSVSVLPVSVIGGNPATGEVSLSANAPKGGLVVKLSSNISAAVVRSAVTVPAGKSSATFTVKTPVVGDQKIAVISAEAGSVTETASIAVNPPPLTALTLTPISVLGGESSKGTLSIKTAAPVGGVLISLKSGTAAATTPATVTIAAGKTAVAFSVTTIGVSSLTSCAITAQLGPITKSADLSIVAARLTALTLTPKSVTGGASSKGTITLGGIAPPNGAVISLSSSCSAISLPATVTVAGGKATATFTVATSSVKVPTTATITASLGNEAKSASLTIKK